MAISFASRVLVRVGGVFVQGVAGVEKLHEVQLALAKRAQEEHLARQVLASGDGKLGEQLVKLDTDTLLAEQRALQRVHEVASNPAEAAKQGITAEPGALERVAADARGVGREVREREIAALMAHVEVKADHAIVEPPVYAELLAKHRAQGSTVVEGFDSAGQPHAKITPSMADGSFGTPFTLHQRLGDEVERILAAKNLPNTAVIGDYLAKRSGDRSGALADLRRVNTPAELDQLMQKTLGEHAAQHQLAVPVVPQHYSLKPSGVEQVAQAIKASGRLEGDMAVFDKLVEQAKAGQAGSLGELEAIQRWLDNGSRVEVLPEHQNQLNASGKPRTNPDYRVDGKLREVKSRSDALDDDWVKENVTKANKQIKNSGLSEQGEAELQLRGPEAEHASLAQVERQVKGNFSTQFGRHLRRVAVYKNGVLFAEWERMVDGTILRTFPP